MNELPDLRAIWLDPEARGDDAGIRSLCADGWDLRIARDDTEFIEGARWAHVVVLRVLNDLSVLNEALDGLGRIGVSVPIVCRVNQGAVALAGAVARAGVDHVVSAQDWSRPTWRELAETLRQCTAVERPRPVRSSVIFADPVSQRLLTMARRVGQADVTALVVGATGTGKEILARVLHESSSRLRGPFVALNCAALPEHLVEDQLFGHERGAFTGAHRDHAGLFEQANGGTLFLDEIGEMPMLLQSKLLRVLQEREITRIGATAPVRVDVRVIAATNKDLRQSIADREFREDLYYRIATFQLRLCSLTERPGDILPLANRCLARHRRDAVQWHLTLAAQQELLAYPWPGNVRELENVMLRAMVLAADGRIDTEHLMFDAWGPEALPSRGSGARTAERPTAQARPVHGGEGLLSCADEESSTTGTAEIAERNASNLHVAVKHNEHQIIMAALAMSASRAEAAERLGISPRTLRYKLAQLRGMGLGPAMSG